MISDSIRLKLEAREENLHPRAAKSRSVRRVRSETKSPVRTEFQRDRDRILHSKSFRRLKHKTQVFIAPEGDHFRTRLTHTLEVSQIARTIARALNLNEDLTEAIALAHDLGHTPFGHIGEQALDEMLERGFRHHHQSLRVVDKLEYQGKGLNLTDPVRDGIIKHSKGLGAVIPENDDQRPETLEGQIVRIADTIAYVNHDLDDAIRARIIDRSDIPGEVTRNLGRSFASRIDAIVTDVIGSSLKAELNRIELSETISTTMTTLRNFLYEHVYWRPEMNEDRIKIKRILQEIFSHLRRTSDQFINPYPEDDPLDRRVIDFIAGMTDRFALNLYNDIVLPSAIY